MIYIYIATAAAVLFSFLVSREKTLKALRITYKRFVKILPAFLTMLVLVSIVLFLVPEELISTYLGSDNRYVGVLIGARETPSAVSTYSTTTGRCAYFTVKPVVRLTIRSSKVSPRATNPRYQKMLTAYQASVCFRELLVIAVVFIVLLLHCQGWIPFHGYAEYR